MQPAVCVKYRVLAVYLLGEVSEVVGTDGAGWGIWPELLGHFRFPANVGLWNRYAMIQKIVTLTSSPA